MSPKSVKDGRNHSAPAGSSSGISMTARKESHTTSTDVAFPVVNRATGVLRRSSVRTVCEPCCLYSQVLLAFAITASVDCDFRQESFSRLLGAAEWRFRLDGSDCVWTQQEHALYFTGVGVALCFRAKVINIGSEGQIAVGGLASTSVALYSRYAARINTCCGRRGSSS